jgi:microcystin-dependent protein
LQLDFDTLVSTLPATYVALNGPGGIEDIISNALAAAGLTGPVTKEYTKMVPYVAYPWFAPSVAGLFDSTGKGIPTGPYENVYFCNGNFPNVPDLRGRVPAGLTNGGMEGLTMDPFVDPAAAPGFNPNYSVGTKAGANYVVLQTPQIPSHTHTTTVVINDPGHAHTNAPGVLIQSDGVERFGSGYTNTGVTSTNFTGLKGTIAGIDQNVFVTNALEGQNQAHNNTQPTVGCYYIMYIPV